MQPTFGKGPGRILGPSLPLPLIPTMSGSELTDNCHRKELLVPCLELTPPRGVSEKRQLAAEVPEAGGWTLVTPSARLVPTRGRPGWGRGGAVRRAALRRVVANTAGPT